MAKVTLKNIFKIYPGDKGKDVTAVRDFNIDIIDREFVVFVGPSGCGKSTTLRMIAGLEEISQGDIFIGDRRVNDVPPKDRDIAMVFQNYALYPHMTVRANMAFALKLRGMSKAEINARVLDAAKILEIEHLLDRKPKALSGGQKQRVAVGRAIVREPKAFLFDEPLSNLDARLRVTTRAELKALHQRLRTTTIYVTHDQEEAMTLGDRIVVMSKGLIQQADAPLTVYREPANRFVAGFIGMPPMNFVDGRIVREGTGLAFAPSPIESGNGVGRDMGSNTNRTSTTGITGRLVFPASRTAQLTPHLEKPLVLGLRPQTLHLDAAPASTADNATRVPLAANVRTVEPLGDCMDISATLESGHKVVARVSSREGMLPESRLVFGVDMTQAHVFEPGEFGVRL